MPHYLTVLLLLPLHGFLTSPVLLLSILFLAAVMCATHLLFPQCFWKNLICCPVFLGTVHCIYCWRLVRSSLSSIFFCQLLWHLYYSCFISLLTVSGHVAKLLIMITRFILSSSSINVHCIWVSLWTQLVFSSV